MYVLVALLSAILSGLLATLVTIFWQNYNQARKTKFEIFQTLLSYRYDFTNEKCVKALNSIDVIFYKQKDIRESWQNFIIEAESNKEMKKMDDKFLSILENIAKNLNYKKINWEKLKMFYHPVGLADKIREENFLRQAQVQEHLNNLKKIEKEENIKPDDNIKNQILENLIPKMFDDPDKLEKFINLSEKFKK